MSFVARNHRQQVAKRGALDHVDDRRTLPEIFDPLNARHKFTLDVAASKLNAKCPKYFTRKQNGLSLSWRGETVWCNPPYSDIRPWVEKAIFETRLGGCKEVVLLLPANRCEQKWWQDLIEPRRDREVFDENTKISTRFLPGRPRFGWPKSRKAPNKGDRPPFGLVVVVIS